MAQASNPRSSSNPNPYDVHYANESASSDFASLCSIQVTPELDQKPEMISHKSHNLSSSPGGTLQQFSTEKYQPDQSLRLFDALDPGLTGTGVGNSSQSDKSANHQQDLMRTPEMQRQLGIPQSLQFSKDNPTDRTDPTTEASTTQKISRAASGAKLFSSTKKAEELSEDLFHIIKRFNLDDNSLNEIQSAFKCRVLQLFNPDGSRKRTHQAADLSNPTEQCKRKKVACDICQTTMARQCDLKYAWLTCHFRLF